MKNLVFLCLIAFHFLWLTYCAVGVASVGDVGFIWFFAIWLLRKHRNGGQQNMVVEHVTVNDGGQAIVGNVTGGGNAPKQR